MLKWKAVINDSIDTYATIHLRRASRQATDRIKKEIHRQFFSPASNPPNKGGNLGANHPPIPRGHNAFNRGLYCEWIKYLFYIEKIIDGTKMFKFSGIGITTNAVSASIH